MGERLTLGSSMSGLLVDGVDGTPWTAATLSVTDQGVQLTVPFVYGDSQFQEVSRWLDAEDGRTNLIFRSHELNVSLFGLRISSRQVQFGGVSEGQLIADDAVMMHRDGAVADILSVEELRSEIDGLLEWSRLSSVKFVPTSLGERRERRNTVTATIEQAEGIEWNQSDAHMQVATSWQVRPSRGFQVDEFGALTTVFSDARPIKDHLHEQRKFVHLLSILFGHGMSFRRHEVRDKRFNNRINGQVISEPFVDLITSSTFRETQSDKPSQKDLLYPMVFMGHLQPFHLAAWSKSYEQIGRALHPILEIFRSPNAVLENRAINAAMSLEALGKGLVSKVDGEEATYRNGRYPSTGTYVLRCLSYANRPCKPETLERQIAFARAIARNYNSIKHPGEIEFPEFLHTFMLSQLAVSIARYSIVRLTLGDDIYTNVDPDAPFQEAEGLLTANGLTMDSDGKISIVVPDREGDSAEA
ncbi:hypothetical protein [Arthrobacter sp. MMS18-M83]|uniref:ApeA N-terminal domain 1-containing protein n=1 Tax=Arthrobacter sp. MMS18-M83 TaxID=2996261 RepID=UPI00227CCF1F|nr:hypothetical protein [Arthrobacter sp. MMS18-M83]WAH97789.1 hypothetical protein OW521_02500 [Arthrobacter sp. MMS18-M83]